MNVAKASLKELLEDYKDYLRVRNLELWEEGSDKHEQTRKVCAAHNESEFYRNAVENRSDEKIANIAIILIRQTDFLIRNYFNFVK